MGHCERVFEVKTIYKNENKLDLQESEVGKAEELGNRYYLIIVYNVVSVNGILFKIIENPHEKSFITPVGKGYIKAEKWKNYESSETEKTILGLN